MSIEKEHKRVKAGEELASLRTRIGALLGELDTIRAALQATKAALQADPDFTPDDVSRVDAVIEVIDNRVQRQ